MTHLHSRALSLGVVLVGAGLFVGCADDATPTDQAARFRVRVENVAPFTHLASGTFDTKVDSGETGALAPGEAFEFRFEAGRGHRLFFATMFGQSNDWFFGPDAEGIALYDEDGVTPISGDITDEIELWDAGTEVDEEPAVGLHTGPKQASSTDGPGADDPNDEVRLVADPAVLSDSATFDRPAVSEMIQVTITPDAEARMFTVRIENVADDATTLMTSEGAKAVRVSPGVWAVASDPDFLFTPGMAEPGDGLEAIAEMGDPSGLAAVLAPEAGVATPVSPGVYVVHLEDAPLYAAGSPDRGLGLEAIAEMGDPSGLAASLEASLPEGVESYGLFDTPVGATEPGAIHPGEAYEFEVSALPGDRLDFAVMYGASNDWIFAPVDTGIALFDEDGAPSSGDVTDEIRIWDVGTEASETPAVGRYLGKPEGPLDADPNVRIVGADEYATPVMDHVRVTITPL